MRHFRARGQRGAALTEYVLLIGLIAIIGVTSEKMLGATASSQFGAAAAQLSGTSDSSPSASVAVDSGSSGTTDTTPSTTTAPATTTTTSTTVAPTTTLAPVTTTTQAPVATQGSTDLTTPTVVGYSSYWWGTSQLIVNNNLGVPLSGARVTLQVKAYTRQWNGTYAWVTTTQTLTTDSDGSVGFYVGPYSSTVTQATVSVSSVTLPNGLTWDGDPSTITVNSP